MEAPLNEKFRDSISTITEDGKRSWVYPKKPSGKFYKYRTWVSYILLAFFIIAPFVKVNDGNQLLLFNVLERKFSIFGFPFWPQDFHLLVISMITGIVFIILFTVVFGRIFCGWMCPQTIFLEMVFRKIEYWIEGDRGKQIRLDKQPWNADKIKKKGLKWLIFFLISFAIANVFLAYLVGGDQVINNLKHPGKHISTFISLLVFTGMFFFIFAWFREQVCIIACPYGRLQGVLLDNKTINVAYDYVRGEKEKGRAKFNKKEDRAATGKGDCIDCKQCVLVCPTGIDIRNGTQLECVNCTACIDECDHMMEKVGLPTGLIRYASEDNIKNKEPFKLTARIKGYIAVLTILIGVLIGMLFVRNDVEATILRLPGQLFQHKENNIIRNVYTYKVINKTVKDIEDVHFKLVSHKGKITTVTHKNFTIPKEGSAEGTLFIDINKGALNKDKTKLTIGVYSKDKLIETATTNFLGPRSFR